jgi:hypothetical protein
MAGPYLWSLGWCGQKLFFLVPANRMPKPTDPMTTNRPIFAHGENIRLAESLRKP